MFDMTVSKFTTFDLKVLDRTNFAANSLLIQFISEVSKSIRMKGLEGSNEVYKSTKRMESLGLTRTQDIDLKVCE